MLPPGTIRGAIHTLSYPHCPPSPHPTRPCGLAGRVLGLAQVGFGPDRSLPSLPQVLGHTKTVLVLICGWLYLGDVITNRKLAGGWHGAACGAAWSGSGRGVRNSGCGLHGARCGLGCCDVAVVLLLGWGLVRCGVAVRHSVFLMVV